MSIISFCEVVLIPSGPRPWCHCWSSLSFLSLLDLIPLLSVSFSVEDSCPWFCFFLHPVRPTCSLVLFTCSTASQPRFSRRGPVQITHFKLFASLASPRNDATLWQVGKSWPGNNIFHPRSLPPPVDIQVCHSEWALDAEAWCEANRPTPIPSEISNNCRLIHYVFTPQWKWSDVGRAVAFVEWIFGSLFKAGYLQIWLSKGANVFFGIGKDDSWNRK